jgi:hypothetical protein
MVKAASCRRISAYAQSREHALARPPRFKHPAGILMLFWLSDII